MQTVQNIFSVFARPFQQIDARNLKRGLAMCAIGAFFVATLAAFAMSASQSGPFGAASDDQDQTGFQPGQEVANLIYRGHIGR